MLWLNGRIRQNTIILILIRMKFIQTIIFTILISTVSSNAQNKALTFKQAELEGKSYIHLDSLYKSAIHSNEELAVFKSQKEQLEVQKAYQSLIFDLSKFLSESNFRWGKTTKCFNRIYFNKKGKIDYFLYSFPEGEITNEKEREFSRLLNIFVKKKKIQLNAKEKFAQCSPIKYNDL